MELDNYRDRFPILAETTYLINHSLGAMPAAAEGRLARDPRTWRGPRAGAVVPSCFRIEPPRNRIVYVEGEFPSVRYLLQAQRDADIVVLPDTDALLDAIDERTLLVPLSHVL